MHLKLLMASRLKPDSHTNKHIGGERALVIRGTEQTHDKSPHCISTWKATVPDTRPSIEETAEHTGPAHLPGEDKTG